MKQSGVCICHICRKVAFKATTGVAWVTRKGSDEREEVGRVCRDCMRATERLGGVIKDGEIEVAAQDKELIESIVRGMLRGIMVFLTVAFAAGIAVGASLIMLAGSMS